MRALVYCFWIQLESERRICAGGHRTVEGQSGSGQATVSNMTGRTMLHYRYVLCSNDPMDKTLEALAQADRHVIESRERIAKQQALVKKLELDGHDSTMAKALLKEFRNSLQLHLIGRATIEAELAKAHSHPPLASSGISEPKLNSDQTSPTKPGTDPNLG